MKASIILDVSDRQIRKREWLSWWSTTLPRSGPRVRVPSRALVKLHIRFLYCFYRIQYICASGSVGGARPCQGRGRGFESRLALYRKKRYTIWCVSFFCRAICAPRGEEIYASHTARARRVLVLRSTSHFHSTSVLPF